MIYTPEEKILIEGAKILTRAEANSKLLLLLDYEMEQYMRELERSVLKEEVYLDEQ